jgi:hypothetical protein
MRVLQLSVLGAWMVVSSTLVSAQVSQADDEILITALAYARDSLRLSSQVLVSRNVVSMSNENTVLGETLLAHDDSFLGRIGGDASVRVVNKNEVVVCPSNARTCSFRGSNPLIAFSKPLRTADRATVVLQCTRPGSSNLLPIYETVYRLTLIPEAKGWRVIGMQKLAET